MGEQIKQTGNELRERWHQRMPRFFYWIVVIACGVGGCAFAINSALPALGGTHADWWPDVYRYILGACIGVVFVCKFTVAGGYKKIDPDKVLRGDQLHGDGSLRDSVAFTREPSPMSRVNMSDVETERPDIEPIDAADL